MDNEANEADTPDVVIGGEKVLFIKDDDTLPGNYFEATEGMISPSRTVKLEIEKFHKLREIVHEQDKQFFQQTLQKYIDQLAIERGVPAAQLKLGPAQALHQGGGQVSKDELMQAAGFSKPHEETHFILEKMAKTTAWSDKQKAEQKAIEYGHQDPKPVRETYSHKCEVCGERAIAQVADLEETEPVDGCQMTDVAATHWFCSKHERGSVIKRKKGHYEKLFDDAKTIWQHNEKALEGIKVVDAKMEGPYLPAFDADKIINNTPKQVPLKDQNGNIIGFVDNLKKDKKGGIIADLHVSKEGHDLKPFIKAPAGEYRGTPMKDSIYKTGWRKGWSRCLEAVLLRLEIMGPNAPMEEIIKDLKKTCQ